MDFDCVVCPECSRAMTAKEHAAHKCDTLTGPCCDNGTFDAPHVCQKQAGASVYHMKEDGLYQDGKQIDHPIEKCELVCFEGQPVLTVPAKNGAGIDRRKLHNSTGRPRGARNLNAKHPSSIARAFKKAGLDWQADFALAIKTNQRARIKLWLRLLPYLITTTNKVRVKRWKGKASRAALVALDALEGKK